MGYPGASRATIVFSGPCDHCLLGFCEISIVNSVCVCVEVDHTNCSMNMGADICIFHLQCTCHSGHKGLAH